MKTLKNYLNQEWFSVFLLALVIITFILVVGNIVKLVELVITKGIKPSIVLKLFIYLMPKLLIYSIPISILTSTLITIGRLSYDNEITAIRSSGISLFPILFNLLLIGLLFALICLYFNDSLIPRANYASRKILQQIGEKRPTAYLEEKTFIKAFKDCIIFIYKIKDNYLEDVRIYQPQTDKPTRTIIAETGEFIFIPEKNEVKLMLRSGTADEPSFEDPQNFYKLNFSNYQITLNLKEHQNFEALEKKVADMTLSELQVEIEVMKIMGVDYRPLIIGLYRKVSLAFSSIVFMFIAMPLAIRIRQREKSLSVALSLIICLLYYLVLATGEGLALQNKLPPFWGVWMANIVFLTLGIILAAKVLQE